MTPHPSGKRTRRTVLNMTLVAAACAFTPAAFAQGATAYPAKPVKIVIGYPAGGAVDFVGRVVAEALMPHLKGIGVIENVGGAAGAIGAQRVVDSAPDGYTLLVGSTNELTATRLVNRSQRYDARKDLTPLGLIGTSSILLVASPNSGFKSIDQALVALKQNPGKYSYGTSGVGSTLHFAGELLKQQTGVFMTHIPYRGVAPLLTDLVGGNIELAMVTPSAAIPFITSGRITALGTTNPQRLAVLPNVPALAEHPQLKGYELVAWFALMAPRNLPSDIATKITTALEAVLRDPAVRSKLDGAGIQAATRQPDMAALLETEDARYNKLVKFAGMTN